MENKNSYIALRAKAWLRLFISISGIFAIAAIVSTSRIRIDLTEDNRYTLSDPTREILSALKNDIYIQVYLEGDMTIPLKRLRRSVSDILEEFRIASGRKIGYSFINPSKGDSDDQRMRCIIPSSGRD